jgi:hypothetical protein
MKICQSEAVPVYIPFVASRLGAAYATGGRIADALPYLQEGVGHSASVGRVGFLSLSMVWLSEGYLLSGRTTEAHEVAARALELAQTHKERGHEAWALKVLGDIVAHTDPSTNESEVFYHRALTLGHELGMRPLEAHCHAALGKFNRSRNVADLARKEFCRAIELYDSMKMTLWSAPIRASLEKIAVP